MALTAELLGRGLLLFWTDVSNPPLEAPSVFRTIEVTVNSYSTVIQIICHGFCLAVYLTYFSRPFILWGDSYIFLPDFAEISFTIKADICT